MFNGLQKSRSRAVKAGKILTQWRRPLNGKIEKEKKKLYSYGILYNHFFLDLKPQHIIERFSSFHFF